MTTDDFTFDDHGSICILYAVTRAAVDWVEEHIDGSALRYGGGVVIEPRYAEPIIDGIINDGLTVCI